MSMGCPAKSCAILFFLVVLSFFFGASTCCCFACRGEADERDTMNMLKTAKGEGGSGVTICIHIIYTNTCYTYIVTQCHTHTHMYTHTHMVANTCRFSRSTIVMHPEWVQIVCMNVHSYSCIYMYTCACAVCIYCTLHILCEYFVGLFQFALPSPRRRKLRRKHHSSRQRQGDSVDAIMVHTTDCTHTDGNH